MRRYGYYSAPTFAAENIIRRLQGVHPAGPGRWRATCPAHGTGRNQALSIRVVDGKILLYCFAGCAPDAVLAALGLSWRDLHTRDSRPWGATGYYRPAPAPATPEAERVARWASWWSAATPGHPLLRAYLRARGLSLTPPPTLRLAVWGGTPLVLARVLDPRGELCGLHLTELKPDGSGRVSKRLAAGSKPLGGAIRLFEPRPGEPLAVAEGVETSLAVREVIGRPAWAAVSAGGLAAVQLPAEVGEVVIAADHDPAGLEAARKLARRLLGEGRKVRMAVPPKPGHDWLDVVAAGEVA